LQKINEIKIATRTVKSRIQFFIVKVTAGEDMLKESSKVIEIKYISKSFNCLLCFHFYYLMWSLTYFFYH